MSAPAIIPRANFLFVLFTLIVGVAGATILLDSGREYVFAAGFMIALAVSLFLTPIAAYLSYRFDVLDHPDEVHKNHERPMPLLGGAALLAAFLIASVAVFPALSRLECPPPMRAQFLHIFVAALFIAAMGIADDKWGLKPSVRLLGQLAAACLVMKGGVMMSSLPPTLLGKMGEAALTILWILGITNSINFLDGIDGLASGVSAIAALSFAAIAAVTGQTAVVLVSIVLAGATLGFLKYNYRPASIYLGDSGATLLGFLLACIGLVGDWGVPDRIEDIFVPVIVLGVPIYDTIYITIYRFKKGLVKTIREWTDYVGRDHLHHRLLDMGMSVGGAVSLICLGSAALGILALQLKTKGDLDRYDKFLAVILAVIFFAGATILMELGRNNNRNNH